MTQTPKQYGPNEVKIVHYPSHNNMYTAGSKIRVYIKKLVGIKDHKIVPVEDPESQPYLLISVQRSKNSHSWFYAVTEDNYYNVEQYLNNEVTGRYGRTLSNYRGHNYEYKIVENSKHLRLTEMHREVAKRVINDYLKEKMNETANG